MLIAALTLDPLGNVSFVIQIIVLFLLILGLPLSKGSTNAKNLIRHGYSTLAALILHTAAILIVMIPGLVNGVNEFATMSFVASVTVWSHVVLGTLAWILRHNHNSFLARERPIQNDMRHLAKVDDANLHHLGDIGY